MVVCKLNEKYNLLVKEIAFEMVSLNLIASENWRLLSLSLSIVNIPLIKLRMKEKKPLYSIVLYKSKIDILHKFRQRTKRCWKDSKPINDLWNSLKEREATCNRNQNVFISRKLSNIFITCNRNNMLQSK